MMRRGLRYSDDSIIRLARQNRGYGLDRMIQIIYFRDGTTRSQRQSRYYTDALRVLTEHKEQTGEDLYAWIEDPDMIQFVSEAEYKAVSGAKYVPKGYGRSVGGRTSKLDRKRGSGEHMLDIPLPPQDFAWGDVLPLWG
jgi:deoxyribodipyrimidine photolyase